MVTDRPDRQRDHRRIVWRAQRMSFWVLYDHLGHLIALNVVMVTTLFLPLWLGLQFELLSPMLALLLGAASLWIAAVGQGSLLNALLRGDAWDVNHVVAGFRRNGLGQAILGLIFLAVALAAGLGIWFYGTILAMSWPLMGMVLAQACACGGVLVALVAFYTVPALIAHPGNVGRALKFGVALAARHPVAGAGYLATACVVTMVMVTPPGFILLSTWPLVSLACCAFELLARHHAVEPPVSDENDMYLNRGFRDFLFPWKG